MGHPKPTVRFDVRTASGDGKYRSRYPQGDWPGVPGSASGAGVAPAVSQASGGATGGANASGAGKSDSASAPGGSGSGNGSFDYYISPTGSNSNPGTISQPWALSALASPPQPISNKTLGLLDGTYVVTPTNSGGNNAGGLAWDSDNTIVRAVNARQAIITTNNGGSYPQYTDPALEVRGSGCTIDGLRFYQHSFDPIRINSDSLTIRNSEFDDINLARVPSESQSTNVGAIFIANSGLFPEVLIENTKFRNIRNGNNTHNGACIGPLYYCGPLTVRRCSFFDAVVAIYWKASNRGPVLIEAVYLHELDRTGLDSVLSNDDVVPMSVTVRNSIINRCGYAMAGEEVNNPHTECHSVLEHLTIITSSKSDGNGIAGIGYSNGLTGSLLSGDDLNQCVLSDTIIHRASGSAPLLFWQSGRNSSLDLYAAGGCNNNMYSHIAMRDANGITYTTMPAWRDRTGQEANSIHGTNTYVDINGDTPEDFVIVSGDGKNAASDGSDIGAWGGGVTQIGCDF